MKKYVITIVFVGVLLMLAICSCGSEEEEVRLRDLDFTIVGADEQPDTLKQVIDEKGEEPYQVTLVNGDGLYLAVGYGKQASGGYSIQVEELYETEKSICVDTTLMGPADEQYAGTPTCPYIVIKTENIEDKPVTFK